MNEFASGFEARQRALLSRNGLREDRDQIAFAISNIDVPSENVRTYQRAIVESLDDANEAYLAALPRVVVARSPFTDEIVSLAIDVYGLDGPWWNYAAPVRPEEPRPATLFAFTGALALGSTIEDTPFLVKPGPGVPYVLPRLLEIDGMQAVIRGLRIGAHRGWVITYFTEHRPVDTQGVNDWGTDHYPVDGGWDTAPEDFDAHDFELAAWIERGKLAWVAERDDAAMLLRETSGCPYLGLTGEHKVQRIEEGAVWAPELPAMPELFR